MENLETDQLLFLVAAVAVAAFWLGRASARSGGGESGESRRLREQQEIEQLYDGLPSALQEEVDSLLVQGKMLEAIKRIREETGMGLREAKRLVDYRMRMLKGAS